MGNQGGGGRDSYSWMYAKSDATRTQINIGGVQDRDTLIEQSLNYSMEVVRLQYALN